MHKKFFLYIVENSTRVQCRLLTEKLLLIYIVYMHVAKYSQFLPSESFFKSLSQNISAGDWIPWQGCIPDVREQSMELITDNRDNWVTYVMWFMWNVTDFSGYNKNKKITFYQNKYNIAGGLKLIRLHYATSRRGPTP